MSGDESLLGEQPLQISADLFMRRFRGRVER